MRVIFVAAKVVTQYYLKTIRILSVFKQIIKRPKIALSQLFYKVYKHREVVAVAVIPRLGNGEGAVWQSFIPA